MHHHLGQQQRERGEGGERDGHGGLVGGAILVALGVAFLAQNTFNVTGLGFRWPFFIIGPGLLLFAAMIAGGRGSGNLAVPASIVTTNVVPTPRPVRSSRTSPPSKRASLRDSANPRPVPP